MKIRARFFMLASLLGSMLAMLVIATVPNVAAAGEDQGDPAGYIEICKTFEAGSPSYTGTFTYNIYEGSAAEYSYIVNPENLYKTVSITAVQGGPQVCTAPIGVPDTGDYTVDEVQQPWFSTASITATQGDPGTVETDDTAGEAIVDVPASAVPGDDSNTATVQYTNDPVTGVVEVCKTAAANSSSLTGTYTFDITSLDDGVNSFSTTASATISSPGGTGCSGPITVPAGTIQTVEPGTTYVTDITATSIDPSWAWSWTDPEPDSIDQLVSSDYGDGTATENVLAGDTTDQTVVTYTDALSTVKLCKQWIGGDAPSTVFPFALTSSGPLGPNAVSSTVGLQAGQCQIVGTVRTGTQVNITEGITPGTKVAAIKVNPTTDSEGGSLIVPGSESLPNRTVSVIAGPGETDVTYYDAPADPGTLKICVTPTTTPAVTPGTAAFTVNGSTTPIDVNLSSTSVQCTIDDETTFAYDSPVTIVGGTLVSPDAFSGTPTVVPSSVEVYDGWPPALTATNQNSLSASTAGSATVLMSEGIITEVTFTVDPPTLAVDPPVTVSQPVSTVGPITVAPVITPVVTDTGQPTVSNPITTSNKVTIGVSAKVRKLEKQLVSIKSQIKTLEHKLTLKNLSPALRAADRRKLTADRALERKLNRELKL